MIAFAELARDGVIVSCAISAGIHAALVPDHAAAEGRAAGLGFATAAALLAALVVALTARPASPLPVLGAAVVLGGLLASYALAITTGVPVLHPEPEPAEALALFTKLVEGAGLLAAVRLLRHAGATPVPSIRRPRGTLT